MGDAPNDQGRAGALRPAAPRPGPFFGWRVVGAAFIVAVFAWGVGFYGPSVFLHALHAERGWPVWLISAAITCHFLLSALIVARLPALHRRFGLVAVTRAGGIAAGLGALAWALAPVPWLLFPAALISGAGWAATSTAAINAMVAPWFERRRPAALSMAYNGASIGGVVFSPLWAMLIAGLGFAAAAAIIGAAMALCLWWLAGRYFQRTPEALGLRPDGEEAGAAGAAAKDGEEGRRSLAADSAAWRDRRFATLSIGFALGLFAQIGLIAHLFSLLVPAMGEAGAGAAMSLFTGCAVLGRLLLGALLPVGADRRIAAALNFAVQIAGSLMLLASGGTSVPLLLAGCVFFGLGVGNLVSLPPLIAQTEFARADVARVVALVTAVNQAAFAFAPAVFGALRDLAGGNTTSMLAAALVQVAAAAVVLAGRRIRA
ncbi:MFS transporter [Plastoroseomonas hellenica]|uniref:MFS transporter n=1 Tax=Plastoroseomonas hellenica TaxID=2687306 RepID=UPI001BAA9259|nr:MFS transporter [Plastoroseomonas hellenica]MBR0641927.1 MFS transporter [Plastoroseomonas hellenica]